VKTLKFPLFLSFALLFLSACERDGETVDNAPQVYQSQQSTFDLSIPNGFNFETTEDIVLDLNLDQAPLASAYLVKVYTQFPSTAASPVFQSFISRNAPLNAKATVPAGASEIYLVLQSPEGSSFLTVVPKTSRITHTFYQAKRKMAKAGTVSPDCVSGCDHTISNLNYSLDAKKKNDVYCLTGSYSTGANVSLTKGSLVRLCGTGTIQSITINDGEVEVLSGADVTVTNFNINSKNGNELIIYPGGSLTITNWFSPNSDVTNYGTLDVAALNLNSGADLENHGTFTVSTNNFATFNGDVDNYGSFSIAGNANINSGSKFKNFCTMTFGGDLQMNGDVDNESYISVSGAWTINSGADLVLENGAMAICEDLTLNGLIEGKGNTSLFKVEDRSDINWGGVIKKNLEFCDANGIENMANANSIKQDAVAACNVVIPSDACNPVGNGQPQVSDADGDGVADELDAYPNDASRASDSYFPSESTYGTLAFEDLWPAYGDYDFNDLVVDYRYQQVLNANNEVVDLKARFVSRAAGGALKLGFGIQLDLNQSAVSAVSGTRYFTNLISTNANGTESGQTKAVIIVYDNSKDVLVNNTGQAFVNTVSGNTAIDPDTANLTISFSNPQSIASLGTAPYNPFIFVDENRGREVHLAGEEPTDKADANLFGTIDDNTDPNGSTTYKSEDNLPWAIHVVGGFNYPEEKTDVSQAYNYFSIWAQSGGLSYSTWYQDQPGYINSADLYQ